MRIFLCTFLSISIIILSFFFTKDDVFDHSSYSDDYIYFEITSPEFLRYTFKAMPAHNFGKPFDKFYFQAALVIVEPSHVCSTILNKLELKNNIGLVQRGDCSFLSKCIEAENTGLAGILIYDNVISESDYYINMTVDETNRNCSLPAAFIQGKDGYMIKKILIAHELNRAFINIPLNLTKKSLDELREPPWSVW